MGKSVVGRWTLGLLVGFGLLLAGNQLEAKVSNFGLLEDMSPALCPAGGVAEFLGNIIIDDITGRVGGLAQIRASSPVTNLADCEGLLGPGFFLDGTLDITITGNIFDSLNLWKCTAFADFKIARRGPLGGLIPIESFFGIFFVGPCDQLINMIHLDLGTLQITLGGGGGLPDLVVTIQPVASTGTIGGAIGLSATVTNVGGATAGAFRLGFYLSTDATITTEDLFLGSCSPSGLAAGQSFTCAGPLPIPTFVLPGDYLVGVIADDESVITEGDESNNTAFTGPITLTGLASLEFKWPSSLFLPDPPEEAEVGVPYPDYTFCHPPEAMSELLCGGLTPLTPQTINPIGGKPPYTFHLESLRGFPPFGMTLSLNGQLRGTPTVAGIFEFGVCVRDSVAKEVCLPEPFRIIVTAPTGPTGNEIVTFFLSESFNRSTGNFTGFVVITVTSTRPGATVSAEGIAGAIFGSDITTADSAGSATLFLDLFPHCHPATTPACPCSGGDFTVSVDGTLIALGSLDCL